MSVRLIKRDQDGRIVQTVKKVSVDEGNHWISKVAVILLLVWGGMELVEALKGLM